MKFGITFTLMMIALSLSSQSFTEDIEVKHFISVKSNLIASDNLDLTTNLSIDQLKNTAFTITPRPIQLNGATPFISVSAAWYETNDKPGNTTLAIRFSTNGSAWDSWTDFKLYDHFEKGRFTETSTQMYIDKKYTYYQLQVNSNLLHEGLNIHAILINFYNPGYDLKACSNSVNRYDQRRVSTESCTCFKPNYVSRAKWNCLYVPTPTAKQAITHIILHHSGGPALSASWEATVLSLWNTSTITYGYTDIAYNWLIAPDGTIYEGRVYNGIESPGDHFCNADAQTIGICMLGSYDDQQITLKAKSALIQLLTWKSCLWELNPDEITHLASLGSLQRTIEGHRLGCQTACPGDSLQSLIPRLRSAVNTELKRTCFSTPIYDQKATLQMTCYPNPSTHRLYLNGYVPQNQLSYYQILSMDGRILKSKTLTVSGSFNEKVKGWDQFKPGVYFVLLIESNHTIRQKVIKL